MRLKKYLVISATNCAQMHLKILVIIQNIQLMLRQKDEFAKTYIKYASKTDFYWVSWLYCTLISYANVVVCFPEMLPPISVTASLVPIAAEAETRQTGQPPSVRCSLLPSTAPLTAGVWRGSPTRDQSQNARDADGRPAQIFCVWGVESRPVFDAFGDGWRCTLRTLEARRYAPESLGKHPR